MKQYWGIFHFMLENLKDQYRNHADASRQGESIKNESSDGVVLEQKSDYHTVQEFFHTMAPSQRQDVAGTQQRHSGTENLGFTNNNLGNYHLHANELTLGGYNPMSPIPPTNLYGSQHDFYWHLPSDSSLNSSSQVTDSFAGEPGSSWFVQFNMEPSEIGQDGPDIFNTMGGAGYGGNG
ncbi:hypothetical protein B0O99DRAFT_746263 [Bisporella sp. PMI_857]|nr:hypothetical protein B0O99DRAFT_746263 [Bisporella sp. PMI_857]